MAIPRKARVTDPLLHSMVTDLPRVQATAPLHRRITAHPQVHRRMAIRKSLRVILTRLG